LMILPTSKSLCGSRVGIEVKTYLYCIYCKVKIRIQEEKCHTLRSRCACVWNIYGDYPNSTMLLEICLSCLKLGKHFYYRAWATSFLSLFFTWWESKYPFFSYLGHLSIFSNTFLFT
jgi:hypothetical protein